MGVLLRWKDQATAEIKRAERTINNLGESVDETTEKTARLQMRFAKLGKVGAGLTAFGLAGAVTLYGVSKAAGTFHDPKVDGFVKTNFYLF
ncbi:MAG: hypothetical protein QME81_13080 [bacterium]|nr:hypothetical protein [bacterium]